MRELAGGQRDELSHRGDYSRWFGERIKDEGLAGEVARVERLSGLSPAESRQLIKKAVEQRYTMPAGPPLPMPGTDAASVHVAHG